MTTLQVLLWVTIYFAKMNACKRWLVSQSRHRHEILTQNGLVVVWNKSWLEPIGIGKLNTNWRIWWAINLNDEICQILIGCPFIFEQEIKSPSFLYDAFLFGVSLVCRAEMSSIPTQMVTIVYFAWGLTGPWWGRPGYFTNMWGHICLVCHGETIKSARAAFTLLHRSQSFLWYRLLPDTIVAFQISLVKNKLGMKTALVKRWNWLQAIYCFSLLISSQAESMKMFASRRSLSYLPTRL